MSSVALRCECGENYHADASQAGGSIRCRCGRVLTIGRAAQPDQPSMGADWKTGAIGVRRRKRRSRQSSAAARHQTPSRALHLAGTAVEWMAFGYLALALVAVVTIWFLSERWWPATLVMFGPRRVLLLPSVPIIAAAALLRRRALLPATAALLIVLFPAMGLRTGWRAMLPAGGGTDTLRVVTFNVADRQLVALDFSAILREWDPDIVALQECGRNFAPALERPAGWHFEQTGWLCLLSRYPIRGTAEMDRSGLAETRRAGVGGAGAVVRHTLDVNGRDVHVTIVHLETPRKGVHGLQAGDVQVMEANTGVRRIESRRARRFVDERAGPQIVLGDFNTTVESSIYRESWGDMANAFSHAGRGFGWTRGTHRIRVRIDHILSSPHLRPDRAFVAPDRGSDHLPVVAELVLLPSRER